MALPAGAGETEKSTARLRAEAKAGDADSQFELGIRLAFDEEPRDYQGAATWFRASAEQGNVEAAHALAMLYHSGRGVTRDHGEAFKWWKVAAEKGHASSQFWVGDSYELGFGTPVDYREAAKWYRLSAEQGDAYGQASLGELYAKGRGVPLDEGEAVNWFRKAAEQHTPSAEYSLGEMYWDGRGVTKDEAAALGWFHRAADQDFTVAHVALGEAYESGRGVEKDLTCAYFWYGVAERSGFELGGEKRQAVGRSMSARAIEEAKRLIAASHVDDGVLSRPLCAGEHISVSVTNAELQDILMVFRTVSGYQINAPPDASGKVTLKVDDVPWDKALTDALASAGYRWSRDGVVITVERAGK